MNNTSYMAITSERDERGRASFTLFWTDPNGIFRNEISNDDGKPVGYRRAQCFHTVPEPYIARGAKLVATEAEAMRLAWGK